MDSEGGPQRVDIGTMMMIDLSPVLKDLLFALLRKLVELAAKLNRSHLKLFPLPHYPCHWGLDNRAESPSMIIRAEFQAANNSELGIHIPIVYLRRRFWIIWIKKYEGIAGVYDQQSDSFGDYPIPPGGVPTAIDATFCVTPPFKNKKDAFTADVIAIDQFGKHHTIWRVRFEYRC